MKRLIALVALIAAGIAAPSATAAPNLAVDLTHDANETQLVTFNAPSGQFRLCFKGDCTTDIAVDNVTTTGVQTALNALPSISAGGGAVSVSALQDHHKAVISFDQGPLAGVDVPPVTVLGGTLPLVFDLGAMVMAQDLHPAGLARNDERLDFTATVRNTGPDPTTGPVSLDVALPVGQQAFVVDFAFPGAQAANPTNGWSCVRPAPTAVDPIVVSCSRADVLAADAAYPPVVVQTGLTAPPGGGSFFVSTNAACAGCAAGGMGRQVTWADPIPFGIKHAEGGLFSGGTAPPYGTPDTQAGGHAKVAAASYLLHTRRNAVEFNNLSLTGQSFAVRFLRSLRADLPDGQAGNPLAVPELCSDLAYLQPGSPTLCPTGSIVGGVQLYFTPDATPDTPIYAIEPERGAPAQFAFQAGGNIYTITAKLRPEDDYGLTLEVLPPPKAYLIGSDVTLCGFGPKLAGRALLGCKDPGDPGAFTKPLFAAPPVCDPNMPPTVDTHIDSFEEPGVFASTPFSTPPQTGCELVEFDPQVTLGPTSDRADAPSGLSFDLSLPSTGLETPGGVSEAHLKKVVVDLPDGVSVNPAAATGLAACSDSQLGLKTDSEPTCPEASKLGTIHATTPVLEETLDGVLVLRTPTSTDPLSGGMLRMALIVRNDDRGILVKLPGSATADPVTGRLTATFDNNPQLPIGTVQVRLRGGDRGVLATPQRCGGRSIGSVLSPWKGEANTSANTRASSHPFATTADCGFGFSPTLAAGNSNPVARGSGTFSFKFTRPQGDQWVGGLTARLPDGLLASVRDVPLCSNAAADAGACPAASKIGVVDAKAGSGDPFVLEEKGEVFLTEGYKGGAYGLAVKIRAVAGPFRREWELSPIVVRQAIHVDRTTAEVTAVSDPLPVIHHGVPLRVREVDVLVDRPGFMLNPSGCAVKQTGARLVSTEGTTADLNHAFQVSRCANLAFKPKLALRLTGRKQTKTGKHPGIKAQVTQNGVSEAGIEQAVVRLPKSLALDVNNAQALCEFVDGTKPDLENHCPKGSIVGRARAASPLLNRPLVGNVYFVKNIRIDSKTGNEIRTLPMIVVALRGEIAVNLTGESSTTRSGKLVNTFANVPDAPISQFNLNIKGGKSGIIAVTRTRKARINLCAGRHVAEADMDGQNGRRHDRDIRMKTPCTKKQTKNAKRAAKRARAARRG